jgi:predicted outer membrane repeat protein
MFGLFRNIPSCPSKSKLSRSQLNVETLEDRSVPAVLVVTNVTDFQPGSLRDAIRNANLHAGHDIIRFAPSFANAQKVITLTTGQINITDDLTIEGPGANLLTVSGNNASRIFNIANAAINVDISGLKLTRGQVLGVNGGAIVVDVSSSLTLKNCVVSGNRAVGGVGGDGGAVYVDDGSLTAINCTFTNNVARGSGGALYANCSAVSMTNCRFINNRALYGNGGALYLNTCQTTLQNCTFTGNRADNRGGAVYHNDGILTLKNCTLTGNSAGLRGGAVFVEDGQATIINSILTKNTAVYAGGAVYFNDGSTVTIRNSTISQNTAEIGGGIASFNQGRLQIFNSTISGNRANGDPANVNDNQGGGGLFLYNVETLIVNSTISGNVDQSAQPQPQVPFGGGGLHLYGGNTVIRNSTIAFNSTNGRGGGILLRDSGLAFGRLNLVSTIVSNNRPAIGNLDVFRPAGEGVVSASFSLIQNFQTGFINNGSVGVLVDVNPLLLLLADNGGPTLTHAFGPGSPVIDAGSNPDDLVTDQRGTGFPRVRGNGIDMGALELV